ncbi:MAG: hypothetical protein OR994_04225 [Candidatus Poseidoniales archaeon]|nr:hypothetical protein [Candidatus Poseidoniales archaeon]
MKYTVVVSKEMNKGETLGVFNWPEWRRPCLIKQVEIRIHGGWIPQGGVSYCEHEELGWVWSQAMIHNGDEEEVKLPEELVELIRPTDDET